ncbi:MAG: HAD family hydrolase [Helcococcus sp.]|nr:HAD family hydrolase [Helcococcus sp.]
MIKLIAVDMDGTLLDKNKDLHKKNIEALEKLHEKGVEIVIATGRSYLAAIPYIKQIREGVIEFLICSNGASVFNLITGEKLVDDTLNKSQIEEIIDLTEMLNYANIHFVGDDMIYTYHNPIGKYIIMDGYLSFLEIKLLSKKEIINSKISKALLTAEKDKIEEIISKIPKKYFEKYNIVTSSDNYIEILNKNIDKGHALETIKKKLKINKNSIVAIGDQQNDVGMFNLAGTSYAMKEASDSIKSMVTNIGPSNNNAGVSIIINELIDMENVDD